MNSKQASVAARIAELSRAPMPELWKLWDRYFSYRPAKPNRDFVESRIAYKLQEEAFGGLSPATRERLERIGASHSKIQKRTPSLKPSTRRLLAKVAAHASANRPIEVAPKPDLTPGTVLLREWGEREHKVMVTATGTFEYEGRAFKSLTAVARHITGTHWSGPLFFGLTKGGAR